MNLTPELRARAIAVLRSPNTTCYYPDDRRVLEALADILEAPPDATSAELQEENQRLRTMLSALGTDEDEKPEPAPET